MKIFDLELNFDEIRERIEIDKSQYKAVRWAEFLKVSESLISNVHAKKKKQNPPLPYIIAVARFTGKPVEYYLYGDSKQMPTSVATEIKPPDNTNSEDSTEKVIAQKILAVLTDIKNANLNGVVNDKLDLMDQKLDICGIELKNVILILERFVNTQNAKKEEFASKKEAS